MVGRTTGDNKFGFTPFIVGETLGDGCNYAGGAGLQQAINDCSAAGGGVVGIRPSTTAYTVNLTLKSNVDLVAFHSDGRLPTGLNHVEIIGQHTWADSSGSAQEIVLNNINFTSTTFGDVFTLSPTAGSVTILGMKFCSVVSNSGAGAGRAFVLNPDGTSTAFIGLVGVNTDSGNVAFNCIGTGTQSIQINDGSSISSSVNQGIRIATGTTSIDINYSTLTSGTFGIEDLTGTAAITSEYATFNCTSAVSFTVAGGTFTSQHTTINASGANYLVGTGTFTHADTILSNAKTLPVTITEVKSNWQPYASSGTSVTAYRGTAGFDSTQFNVTDGFVTLSGGGEAIDSFSPDSGTDPVVPTAAGLVNMKGSGSITTVGSLNTLTTELTGLTNHNVLVGAGTTTITNVSPSATSGVPLISQGAAADPAFGTALVAGGGTGATSFNTNGAVISNTTTTGALAAVSLSNQQFLAGNTSAAPTAKALSVNIQTFTSSGTYTPTAGMVYCIIEAVGSGGGGGGSASAAANFYTGGGGGGGGGYARKFASAATIGASQTVTIGNAGTGGSAGNNPGTAGSDCSLGIICVAKGGSGGSGNAGSNSSSGGAGGVAGTGDITFPGGAGFASLLQGTGTGNSVTAAGGCSFFGAGAAPLVGNGNPQTGPAGQNYGSGGGGGVSANAGSAAAGGNGAKGVVIITEYIIA